MKNFNKNKNLTDGYFLIFSVSTDEKESTGIVKAM